MAVTQAERLDAPKKDALLWAGVLMGPIAWALDEGLSYSLEQHSCSTGHHYVLHVISICCLLFALAGAWIARTQLVREGEGNENGGTPHDRRWWMARLGVAFGLGFSLVIIAIAIPKLLLSPCE